MTTALQCIPKFLKNLHPGGIRTREPSVGGRDDHYATPQGLPRP
jgi:hypothetical protein